MCRRLQWLISLFLLLQRHSNKCCNLFQPRKSPTEARSPTEPPLAGTTLPEQREIFRLGYQAYQAKDHEKAKKFLQRALEIYPVLADYSLYFLGSVHRDDGQTIETRAFFQRLISEYPDSVWNDHATLELAKLALAESNWGEAVRYAEQARHGKASSAFVRHEALLVLAQAQEGQDNLTDAYNLYQELRRITPHSSMGKTAKERVDFLRAAFPSRFGFVEDRDYLDEIRLLQKRGETPMRMS